LKYAHPNVQSGPFSQIQSQFVRNLFTENTLQDGLKVQSSLLPWGKAVELLCIMSYKWWGTWYCPTSPATKRNIKLLLTTTVCKIKQRSLLKDVICLGTNQYQLKTPMSA